MYIYIYLYPDFLIVVNSMSRAGVSGGPAGPVHHSRSHLHRHLLLYPRRLDMSVCASRRARLGTERDRYWRWCVDLPRAGVSGGPAGPLHHSRRISVSLSLFFPLFLSLSLSIYIYRQIYIYIYIYPPLSLSLYMYVPLALNSISRAGVSCGPSGPLHHSGSHLHRHSLRRWSTLNSTLNPWAWCVWERVRERESVCVREREWERMTEWESERACWSCPSQWESPLPFTSPLVHPQP